MVETEHIYSTLRGEGPEMDALIAEFIGRLPHFRSEIDGALEQKNRGALKEAVHKIKGLGGGYGYVELTSLARKVEQEIANNNEVTLAETTQQLILYIDRIIASGL
ncbi:MAG: Hpt domain-containing protein [Pseudomonadota bacterium]